MGSFLYKLRKNFFSEAFIGISISQNLCNINIDIIKRGRIKKNIKKEFIIKNHEINGDVTKFLYTYLNSYNFSYISTVINANNQGALIGCTKDDLHKFNINSFDIQTLCIDKKWQTYVYLEDINFLKNRFNDFELDFIISPFVILHFIQKDIDNSEPVLYILLQKEHITFSIFDINKSIAFSEIIEIELDNESSEEEDTIDIEEVDNNNEDDAPSDEDKDTLEDDNDSIDSDAIEQDDDKVEMDDSAAEIDAEIGTEEEETEEKNNDNSDEKNQFEKDKQKHEEMDMYKSELLLNNIQISIDKFYKNELYESEFISKVVIATDDKLTNGVSEYIEEELMLDVELLHINVPSILSKIIYAESLNSEI